MDARYDVGVVGGGAAGLSGLMVGAAVNADLMTEDTRLAVVARRQPPSPAGELYETVPADRRHEN
jgi:hypothetical protein